MSAATPNRDYDVVEPYAPALIESLRAVGYDLPTAVADLVDNSLSAEATRIEIEFVWAGEQSIIAVADNGTGMTEERLVQAMRLGSADPMELRARTDLGRFGLGLKTASFSQCRQFTVYTKPTRSSLAVRRWDLDYVRKSKAWRVLRSGTEGAEPFGTGLHGSGTVVVWEKLDRLVSGMDARNANHRDQFNLLAQTVEQHLAMVFQRFMTGPRSVHFSINGARIEPWDPFLEHHASTQHPESHALQLKQARIQVDCFVLPHHSKLTPAEHGAAAGPRGWLAHQGFYIYRNKRLLVPGDWLDLGVRKEEHYKLARLRIDIPNTVDDVWHIDIKKGTAKVPAAISRDLANLGRVTRERAVAVYRHRGKVIQRSHSAMETFVWQQKLKHGKIFYHVNRDHPLVKGVLEENKSSKGAILALLRLIEESVPIPLIIVTSQEKPDTAALPFESAPSDEIYSVMVELFLALVRTGQSPHQAIDKLRRMDPFDRFPEYIENLPDVLKARGVS